MRERFGVTDGDHAARRGGEETKDGGMRFAFPPYACSPDIWRRRNHLIYEFLCYVNNLIGYELSENQDGSQIFIERARSFMLEHAKSHEIIDAHTEKYFDLVRAYIHDIGARRAYKERPS